MTQATASEFGGLLKQWRAQRRVSQLDLALSANVSSRHLSFIETGRARPSRQMIMNLSDAMDIPLRDRNLLLQAAGFAPIYKSREYDDAELAMVRRSIEFMLDKHEPYPAVILDRAWNVKGANMGAGNLLARFLSAEALSSGTPNILDTLFDPEGLRPFVVDWPVLASYSLRRLIHDAAQDGPKSPSADLLKRVRERPGVKELEQDPPANVPTGPMLNMELQRGDLHLKLFTVIATFGTPQDITVEELRIETIFPADEDTKRLLENWAVA